MMFSFPVFRLEVVEECSSTNEVLMSRHDRADFPGTALLAHRQTGGQGRRGRKWETLAGNMALSLAFRTADHRQLPLLTFLLGLAAHRAVAKLVPAEHVTLKWPNDIYLNGRKLAGILAQAKQAAGETDVVAGIGVNLAAAPEGLEPPAAALAEFIAPPAPEAFARALLAEWSHLAAEIRDFSGLRERWEAAAGFPGVELSIVGEPGTWRPIRLLPTGELEVEAECGTQRRLASETVSVRVLPEIRA